MSVDYCTSFKGNGIKFERRITSISLLNISVEVYGIIFIDKKKQSAY